MNIAYYVRKGEYKFYNLEKNLLEQFKEKYKAKQWRIVEIDDLKSKKDAIAYADKKIEERIQRIKYITKNKTSGSSSQSRKDSGAYAIRGSLKQYLKLTRDFKPYQPKAHKVRNNWTRFTNTWSLGF